MNRFNSFLALSILFTVALTSCGEAEDKSTAAPEKTDVTTNDAELSQKIDDSIAIIDEAGSFDLRIKGERVVKNYKAQGGQAVFEATQTGDVITGKLGINDANKDVELTFEFPSKLGFQSLDSKDVTVKATIKDGTFQAGGDVTTGKVSLTRAKVGNYLVGNVSGMMDIEFKPHTFYCVFQIPLK